MTDDQPLFLPAIKGRLGIRFYYTVLMTLKQISLHIKIGEEIYGTKKLSEMSQRALRGRRQTEISDYLLTQPERFFNAMIVGVYGGNPRWEPFKITAGVSAIDASSLRLDTVNSFGFLVLDGNERLFPLDGQHRLAGIREALRKGGPEAKALSEEEVAVIFIPHDHETKSGRERSRRLFTVLNKRAKAVDPNEIIALDEDDVMAIVTRMLVEDYAALKGDRVWYSASTNIPATGKACFTTIGTLYGLLGPLFRAASGRTRAQLEDNRPSDAWLEYYRSCGLAFFDALRANIPAYAEFARARKFGAISERERGEHGGHLLFRPAGLRAFAEVVAAIVDKAGLGKAEQPDVDPRQLRVEAVAEIKKAVAEASTLPLSLNERPHRETLWNPHTQRIQTGNRTLARDLMLDMLGRYSAREALRVRYAKALGKTGEAIPLPSEARHSKRKSPSPPPG